MLRSSDQIEDALLDTVRQLGDVLGDGVAVLLEACYGLLEFTSALAQFTLEADAGFADLALEPVAGGVATALEATQLGLSLGGRTVARDRVVDGRDDPFAGDQGGANGDQDRALGVVAEYVDRVPRRRLGLVDRARASLVALALVLWLRALAELPRRAAEVLVAGLPALALRGEVVLAVAIWSESPVLSSR